MNVNLTHECWKDVPIRLLHVTDGACAGLHLPFLVCMWAVLTLPFFLVLRVSHSALHSH